MRCSAGSFPESSHRHWGGGGSSVVPLVGAAMVGPSLTTGNLGARPSAGRPQHETGQLPEWNTTPTPAPTPTPTPTQRPHWRTGKKCATGTAPSVRDPSLVSLVLPRQQFSPRVAPISSHSAPPHCQCRSQQTANISVPSHLHGMQTTDSSVPSNLHSRQQRPVPPPQQTADSNVLSHRHSR